MAARSVSLAMTLLSLTLVARLGAQPAASDATALPPLLPDEQEIRLALSAAPPELSGKATVYALRRGGHAKVRDGTNGVTCLVERDHRESLYPICYDAEGSRTILPISLLEGRLREQGKSEDEIEQAVALAVARGELRIPSGPAIAYMMSSGQVLFNGPKGERVGAWKPHIMIYMPYLTAEQLGFAGGSPPGLGVRNPGKLMAHLVIVTPTWSDGRPGAAAGKSQ